MVWWVVLVWCVGTTLGRDLKLYLNKVNQTTSPLAKCLDGSPPAYYWRPGVLEAAKSAVLFMEGGGWCFPSDEVQSTGSNCAERAKTALGSSTKYGPSITSMGYEGGNGFASGNPAVTAWANWAFAYIKYCDGGSMTGTKMDAAPAHNGSAPLWYRGKYNLDAVLDHMVEEKGLKGYKEIIVSGCSAGGMNCYLHCDYIAHYFHPIPTKCICDAGVFLDLPTVTGAGNVMMHRFFDVADQMESKQGVPAECVKQETDWRRCIFSQYAIKYMKTPTFLINSLYNFAEWTILAPSWLDTSVPPPDWRQCYPHNGGLSPTTYEKCNTTQKTIIQSYRTGFLSAVENAINPSTPHGAFLDSCPNQHCQTSTGWTLVHVDGTTMADAAARWYFNGTKEKHVDAPFPGNPTCGYKEGVVPICNNCPNAGLGSNCLWDVTREVFHGL